MEALLLALSLFLQNGLPISVRTGLSSVNVVGAWEGDLLPPGVSPFETIQSSVTFLADGTYVTDVFKPTGDFRGHGTYFLQGDVLTLGEEPTAESFRVSRRGQSLTLQPVGQGVTAFTLSALGGRRP